MGPALQKAAEIYLANGGRLIDTAQLYGNHRDLAKAIKNSGLDREDFWVTSKVLVTKMESADDVVRSVDESRQQLGLDYIDLMLLHGGEAWGIEPVMDKKLWSGLLEAQKLGMVKSVGVSNHNKDEILRLKEATGVLPAVNQIEFHPWVPEETKDLVKWCQSQGMVVTAYGSLGGANNKAEGLPVDDVAEAAGASNAQVLLRWALDKGVAVIPGASTEAHIKENLQLTGFKLKPGDSEKLEGADKPVLFRRWHSCLSGCAD